MAKKLFVEANTEAGINAAETAGTLNAEIAFIKEQGNEGIHAKGKTYQTIPSNGKDGQVLMASNGKGVWTDLDVIDMLSYGVEWNPHVADPTLTRIGNMYYHKTLPIQSGMKGCVYDSKKKKVVYWLYGPNWEYKEGLEPTKDLVYLSKTIPPSYTGTIDDNQYFINSNSTEYYNNLPAALTRRIMLFKADKTILAEGTIVDYNDTDKRFLLTMDRQLEDSELYGCEAHIGSRLDGYDGEVMVYVPEFYIRSWNGDDKRSVRISPTKIDGTWEHQPALFVGAYRDTILGTVPENMGYLSTLEEGSAVTIANRSTYCRGGNAESVDEEPSDIFKSTLGKCRTGLPRPFFREAARKVGKEIMSYRQYKNILYWLWVIEYATFNSQDTFNPSLTPEGFHQGGLGKGLTTVTNWSSYNNSNPITPNGYTDKLGNRTGYRVIEPGGPAHSQSLAAVRWRGIENPFGDVWTHVDGIVADSNLYLPYGSTRYHAVYTTDDPNKYFDGISESFGMELSGAVTEYSGYIVKFDLGVTSEIIPSDTRETGSSVEFKCDYCNTFSTSSEVGHHTVLLGGCATGTNTNGLSTWHSSKALTGSGNNIGFRTVAFAQ